MMINAFTLASAVALLGFASCNAPMQADMQRSQDDQSRVDEATEASDFADFGIDLFRRVQDEVGTENLFLAPASVAFALAMTHEGARGATQAEIARLLGLESTEVAAAAGALADVLDRSGGELELQVANSLWAAEGIPFRRDFLESTRTRFGAEVTTLDFADPAAAERINAWVSARTSGRIPRLLERLRPEEVLFLVNAVYFKGQWTRPFDPRLTQPADFTRADGSPVSVPMMAQTGEFGILRGEGWSALRLPYGEAQSLAMYVFLPDAGQTLEAFYAGLDGASWRSWMEGFRESRMHVSLPRFRLEYARELTETLRALGMSTAFDPAAADFSGMLPREFLDANNAYVSRVEHKTFVEVNEEGTEAAGATGVGIGIVSMPPEFRVDRPFFFAIRDEGTGALLFAGQISDPR